MRKEIFITTSFIGYHCWPEAPEAVKFLRNLHRHIFRVRLGFLVVDSDRELEFFLVKAQADHFIKEGLLLELAHKPYFSCEMMAEYLIKCFQNVRYAILWAEVDEDGENGARVSIS
jgi:hypothetical protein